MRRRRTRRTREGELDDERELCSPAAARSESAPNDSVSASVSTGAFSAVSASGVLVLVLVLVMERRASVCLPSDLLHPFDPRDCLGFSGSSCSLRFEERVLALALLEDPACIDETLCHGIAPAADGR